jgi:hypothetical protein
MRHEEFDLKAKKLRKLLDTPGIKQALKDEDMRHALMFMSLDWEAVDRAITILRLVAFEEGIEQWRAAQKAASTEKESEKKLRRNSSRASKAEQPYAVELVLVESHR